MHTYNVKYVSGAAKTGEEKKKTAGSNQFGIQRSDHPKRGKSWQPNSTISVLYPTSCTLVDIRQENKKTPQNLLISGAQSNGSAIDGRVHHADRTGSQDGRHGQEKSAAGEYPEMKSFKNDAMNEPERTE
ncbi:hypothetical protein EAG_13493 [Camponotus floridanus]|uniref:Uncharacterized protein n=1 Tax=Camponotus floridanus TaxID=104421 RepID=E2AC25_CAMFO|nr:hypothetical protein EAG_13493 [Camponotus floridanus]